MVQRPLLEAAQGRWWRNITKILRPHREVKREIHFKIRKNVAGGWSALIDDVWLPVLTKIDRDAEVRLEVIDLFGPNWPERILKTLLEVCVVWAEDYIEGHRPDQIREARRAQEKADADISDALDSLASALELKAVVSERYGVHSHWQRPGIELWEAILGLLNQPRFKRAGRDIGEAIQGLDFDDRRDLPTFLDLVSEMGCSVVSKPEFNWPDDAVSGRPKRGQGNNSPAEWTRRLLVAVDRAFGELEADSPADLLFTESSLCALLCVSTGREPGDPPFTRTAVREQLAAWRRDHS